MSPWRVLLSIDAWNGLMPPVPRISVRFLRSASLKVCSSMAFPAPALERFPEPAQHQIIALPEERVMPEEQRRTRHVKGESMFEEAHVVGMLRHGNTSAQRIAHRRPVTAPRRLFYSALS